MSFFPQQDTGRINGYIQGDQDISFVAMSDKLKEFNEIVMNDPAVDTVTAFTGGGNGTSTSRMFAQLKPLEERKISADQVIARLRGKTARIPGAQLFLQSVQDLEHRRTLRRRAVSVHAAGGESGPISTTGRPLSMARFKNSRAFTTSTPISRSVACKVLWSIDRDTASRLGVNMTDIDNTLGDAFGQRQVSNIYKGLNQYHVVLEVSDNYTQGPEGLTSHLRALQLRWRGSSQLFRPLRTFQHFAFRQSPGSIPFDYSFL